MYDDRNPGKDIAFSVHFLSWYLLGSRMEAWMSLWLPGLRIEYLKLSARSWDPELSDSRLDPAIELGPWRGAEPNVEDPSPRSFERPVVPSILRSVVRQRPSISRAGIFGAGELVRVPCPQRFSKSSSFTSSSWDREQNLWLSARSRTCLLCLKWGFMTCSQEWQLKLVLHRLDILYVRSDLLSAMYCK